MPVTGWMNCTSGTKVTNRQTSGTWYLHALATYDATGATAYDSRSFNFSSGAAGELPELNVFVDNSTWARERKINITTRKPAGAAVTVRTPSGSVQTVTGTSYTATVNGCYTFTLTAGEEKIVKSVTVAKIDRMAPAAQVTEPAEKIQTENATFTVTPADAGGSGVKNVTGKWTKTTNGGSAVTENAVLTKQDDGTYQAVTPGSNGSTYTYRLNLTVTDHAGNTATASSATFTVNRKVPTVTVTKTGSTSKGDTYTYTVNANGNTITAVNLPNSGNTTALSGSFTLTAAGTYYVTVSDQAGHVVTSAPMTVADGVDGDAPEVRAYQRDTDWTKTAKIELSIYEESEIKEIKLQGQGTTKTLSLTDGSLKQDAGSSSAYRYTDIGVTTNGTYTIIVTDANGNQGTAKITVGNVDRTAPVLTAKANATPKASGWYTDSTVPVVMTFSDPGPAHGEGGSERSGIASVQYKLVSKTEKDKGTEPSGLKSVPDSEIGKGTYTVSLTQMGIWYLYVKVTDVAGNEYKGYCNMTGTTGTLEIKKDQSKGSLVSLTGPVTAQKETNGLAMTITVNYGPSGAEMTATGQAAPIGTLAPHDGPSTKRESVNYTTKQIGVNHVYIKPASWGSKYYWTYYVRRVTFDSQGGSDVPSLLVWTKQNSTSGGTTVDCKVEKPADPTRKGYTFGGWYTDAACTDGKEFDFSGSQTQVRTDTTLYAKWTQDVYKVEYDLKMPEYIIHFSHNRENTDCTNNKSYSDAHRHYQCEKSYTAPEGKTEYRYGDKMKLPVPVLETVRGSFEYEENGEKKTETHSYSMTGFTFDGWYDNPEYTGRKYTEIEADATGNKRYYARWQDTQKPAFGGGFWRYGSSYGDWFGTHLIGKEISDNADIDLESIEGQVDGGDWVKPARIDKPDYHYGSSYVAWFGEGSANTNLSDGRHTIRIRVRDKAGNLTVSPEYVIYNDRKSPKGDMTCSVEPTECYMDKDGIIYDEKGTGRTKIQFFKEVPTYRVSAEDIPADNGLYSGLYRVSYILTDRDMATGTEKPSTEEPKYTNPQTKYAYFSGLLNGTTAFTLPENWRGNVTSIYVRDRVNNSSFIPAIGEVVVDTLAPTIRDEKISFINDAGEDIAEIQDKWYSQQELANMGALYFGAHVGAEGNELLGAPIRSVSWLINGKNTGKGQTNTKWEYTDLGASTVRISDLMGVNDITVEAVDFAGNKTTVTKTLKIKGGKERTPEAARDYPADALSQLSKNADYVITVDGKNYTVNAGAEGKIPFVLTHDVTSGVAAGKEVDLCGKTITIVKKGITENGEECSKDSDAQTLTITERPAALAADKISFEAELLDEAEDAEISLTIDADSYTYECSADNGKTWREVPSDNTIKNLPKGNMLIRAKAKANTVDNAGTETNDGWPHGRQSVKTIGSSAGKVIAEFDLNDGSTGEAYDSQTVSYKSALEEPTAPTRNDYQFMGWYTESNRYQPGGTTDKSWRFESDENANIVGEILGTDRDSYKDRIQANGSIRVKLYAGWRETKAPELKAVLETDTSADGSGVWKDVTGTDQFYPNLRVKLTYSDNVAVTKLYYKPYKKTSGSYTELNMGSAKEDGTSSFNTTQFTLPYTNLGETSSTGTTYTFKVEDAAGNVTEQEVTYKLDKTLPVLGEASFTSGHKNIWHWIIRKSNLNITIPVTETRSGLNRVEYTLTPFTSTAAEKELTEEVPDTSLDTGKAVTKNATLSSNKDRATITLPADFKGAVAVMAVDNAGNRSEVKKIGVELPGVKGLFVENNAPVIDVKADDAAISENYYDTAPRLSIHVEDKTNGVQKNAGIASVTWKIDRTPRGGTKQTGVTNTVKADFDAAPTRDYDFTLNELAGKTGVFDVTIIATDQAGNRTTKTVKINVKSKAETPDLVIDYAGEKLTGLVPGAIYDVRGETITADENGCISIAEEWFGTNFQISRKAYSAELLDSDYAADVIAARPDAPAISLVQDETIRGKNDAQISGANEDMEYSADSGRTWTDIQAEDLTEARLNVPAGLIRVRVKATDNAPHGYEAEVTPKAGRTLTVTFNPMGGSNVSSVTDQSWHDTITKPDDPVKAGYEFVGWYQDAEGAKQWHFEGGAETADRLTGDTTLYAKWRDIEKPSLAAALMTGTENADPEQWYPDLSIDLTYSDNSGVTKLYVSKDGGDDILVGSMGGTDGSADISDSVPQGKTADGYVQYHFTYDDIAEGSHTYTFKAEDADGNIRETEALTAKLDTTRPVLGDVSFDSGHKSLWSWIVRNDILLITVPITETGSGVEEVAFTLTPADDITNAAVMTGSAKAEKVSDGSADYRAVIAVASDFKGTIRIETQDKVGNKADVKTVGTNGGDMNGVIVENNAPMITVHADRDIMGAAALADTSGMTLSEEYYETAPELTVNVTDEESDTMTGLITGGIASLTYKIGEAGETAVRSQDEYKTAIRTTDNFTIPADKIPAGVTDITITATDHAGNVSKEELTIKVKTPLDEPQAKIGYVEETLTGLVKEAPYWISVESDDDGAMMMADADGKIKLEDNWIGKTLRIVQFSSEDERSDSPAQSITIPGRPAAPAISTVEESHPLRRDGKITGLMAGTAYEISEDGGILWKWRDAVLTGTEITGLTGAGSVVGDVSGSAGTYHVRMKAVDGADGTGNFSGMPAVVRVQSGPIEKFQTPDPGIAYRETSLTGLAANAEYILEYEMDGEIVTGLGTTDEDGNMIIEDDWMGKECQIIRSGYGLPGADSDPQSLTIKSRPEAPAPMGKEVSGEGREDGKLFGLTAGAAYEISTDDGETWTKKTADDNGEITGLGAAKYVVRVPATDTSFASLPSKTVSVNGHYAVTLHGNGGKAGTTLTDYIEESGAVLPTDWTRTGYSFVGWYDNADCSGEAVTNISGTDTGAKEYWAKWKDNIAPVIGKLTYSYQPKLFRQWLIGKDSLVITVPVKEEGSGADKITYIMTPEGGKADRKTSAIKDGLAKITVSADFKGTIGITCTDKAGNTSTERKAGAELNAAGFIIEDNAPQIGFMAGGGSVKKEYKKAPAVTVVVADDKNKSISAGLSSVKYRIGSGKETSVAGDFTTGIKTGVRFVIPANKIKAGKTVITVTVIDYAGNRNTVTQTIQVNTDAGAAAQEKSNIELHSGLKAAQKGKKLQASWGRVKGADGYDVYVQYCNRDFSDKSLNQVKSGKKTKFSVKKINGRKLNTKKNFKLYVVAYQKKNGKKITLAKTLTVHIAGEDSTKYTNIHKIKTKKTSYTLKRGGTVALRPKAVLQDKHKKQLSAKHTREFRYLSSNKKIVAVTAGGKVKAKGTGSCTIYVFAKNGCKRKIKIKVKKASLS